MLVLTRKIGEEIVLGDTIRVTVLAIQKGRIRLGISAPQEVNVQREELRPNPVDFDERSEPALL